MAYRAKRVKKRSTRLRKNVVKDIKRIRKNEEIIKKLKSKSEIE